MELLVNLIDKFLHINKYLNDIVQQYGSYTYLLLFLVIFCETGLVVMPFLPGDSLLFAAGALCASTTLNVHFMFFLLTFAAIIGDGLNYYIGTRIGLKAFQKESKIFRKEYLHKTQKFYDKYGGKTIVIARFIPIVRTFAPFLAGVGKMKYSYFLTYNIVGALLWISLFLYGGYLFGNLEAVKKNFSLVILAIIVLSILPAIIEYIRERKQIKNASPSF